MSPSAIYIGIDPGVHACGVAVVQQNVLRHAMWARTQTAEALDPDIVNATMRAVVLGISRPGPWAIYQPSDELRFVVEMPETENGRARGNAATTDLLELCFVIGRIVEGIRNAFPGAHIARAPVSVWKRGVPTDALESRLFLAPPLGLTKEEHERVVWPARSYRHNVVDAIALARWGQGR